GGPGAPDLGVADLGVADLGVADFGIADFGIADFGIADFGVAGLTAAAVVDGWTGSDAANPGPETRAVDAATAPTTTASRRDRACDCCEAMPAPLFMLAPTPDASSEGSGTSVNDNQTYTYESGQRHGAFG
ncbi:hypothetical protein, partial [Streptomyces sp. NPDC059378]|uniref:hypothetical protein n=1 Tax=Streptomyces sp. NPDC059378 TaxID=3346815 RepID=UPI0036B7C6A8